MNKSKLLCSSVALIVFVSIFSFVLIRKVSAYGIPGAPACNSTAPGTPSISNIKSLGGGSVELTWLNVAQASSWTVAYGTRSGVYVYGVSNFGDGASRSIKISNLPSGRYYFVLRANNGCAPGAFSSEKNLSTSGSGSSSLPVTYKTSDTTGTTKPIVISPTPKAGATNRAVPSFTASPKALPTGTSPKVGFWDSIANFFKTLFK